MRLVTRGILGILFCPKPSTVAQAAIGRLKSFGPNGHWPEPVFLYGGENLA